MSSFDEHTQAGIAAMEDRKLVEAVNHFTKAHEIEPDRPDINNLLGTVLMASGQLREALGPLEVAVRLAGPFEDPDVQPMKRQFHMNLAHCLLRLDEVYAARKVLETAVGTWPQEAQPRLQLGQLLLQSCSVEDGKAVYRALAELDGLDEEACAAAAGMADCIEAFQQSEHSPELFLQSHQESYVTYFNEVTSGQEAEGWYTEAARMARGTGDEPKPIIPDGARPYAMQRVDLVNPENGEVASVYSDTDPMIVSLNGYEPLAQAPVVLRWNNDQWPFEVWVSSRCPWHWLGITVEFADAGEVVTAIDEVIGPWYLAGFNGDFGTADAGRFHYVTDPEQISDRIVSYNVDLGRANFEAIRALMTQVALLHERTPLKRVLFGIGRLPH